uniref:Uncharacterized protein n=1 Tax=Phaeodactylum tricornutum TaxID=2850 RepID=A0A8J9S2K4_PHATR
MNRPRARSMCCKILLPLLCAVLVLDLWATNRSNIWSGARLQSSNSLQTKPSGHREPCNCSLSLDSNRDQSTADQHNLRQKEAEKLISETPPLRFCRIPRIQFGPRSKYSKYVTFQCGGEAYYQLGQRLSAYGERRGTHPTNKTTPNVAWGRRSSVPLRTNQSALFFGNSHTRQILESFLCQYQEYIVDGSLERDSSENVGIVRFANNATVQWLINSWVAFSEELPKALPLELIEPRPLDTFDVVVLGAFNNLPNHRTTRSSHKKATGSAYLKAMEEASNNHPDLNWTKPPPTLLDLAETCSAKTTLVGVSMFKARGGSTDYDGFLRHYELLQEQGRSTVHLLKSRQHIATVGEGGSNQKHSVDEALEGAAGEMSHRCTGPHGSVVDLTVWDFVEVLTVKKD